MGLRHFGMTFMAVFALLGTGCSVQGSLTALGAAVGILSSTEDIFVSAAKLHLRNQRACAILSSGKALCWGANEYYELGDGTTISRNSPVTAVGLEAGVTEMDTFTYGTSCAVVSGALKCWGEDGGQFGSAPSYAYWPQPQDVTILSSNVTKVATGYKRVCVVQSGAAKCMGDGSNGQLGDGNNVDSVAPVIPTGLGSGVADITAAFYHTCALLTSGAVQCWGENGDGQLGDNSTTDRDAPVAVSGLGSGVTQIDTSGSTVCAVHGGAVKCWGAGEDGELGDGAAVSSSVPVQAQGLTSGFVKVSVSGGHACALKNDGTLKCWGSNGDGQLGDGSNTRRTTPVDATVVGESVSDVETGDGFTCAILVANGRVKCWGANSVGQLGDGEGGPIATPVQVVGLDSGVTQISSAGGHACVLQSGIAKCWGANGYGQLGDGTTNASGVPVAVLGLGGTASKIEVSAGGFGNANSCALVGGDVKCWGNGGIGQLGDGNAVDSLVPVTATGLAAVTDLFLGNMSGFAIMAGQLWSWGWNNGGRLGNGSTTDESAPVMTIAAGVTKGCANANHACAIVSGGLQCWANNNSGEYGDGTTVRSWSPAPSLLTSGVTELACGNSSTYAIQGGALMAMGSNSYGELGDGTTTDSLIPLAIALPGTPAKMAAGSSMSCSLLTNGEVYCWGQNSSGQLGLGTLTAHEANPQKVALPATASQISTSGESTCALLTTGAVYCWGSNSSGALGNGHYNSLAPVSLKNQL